MKVSVIVPNYNHAPFLKQRIESIMSQSYQDFELILLDDCSTDGGREILESYRDNPHVTHVVCNDTNGGSAFRQWDKGIALAKGEWIWIAESDDWAETTFVERMMQSIEKHPTCGLAYCWSFRTDENGTLLWDVPDKQKINFHRGEEFVSERLVLSNVIVNVSSCMFKREFFKPECACLYENMRLCGDWLFYVLLAEQTDVVEVQSPLNYCRRHGTNISESAEAKGLTFLEGADVLDYVLEHHEVKKSFYSRYWGRQWAKYRRIWGLSAETNDAIHRRFITRHKAIVLYYYVYVVRNLFRK